MPYRPYDLPNPINVYGQSKLAGEKRVLETIGDNALILRTTRLYSNKGPSFLYLMLKLLQKSSDLYMVNDQFSATTRVSSLVNMIFSAAQKNVSGIHHWTDFDVSSWYDFACATRDHLIGLGLTLKTKNIHSISLRNYLKPAQRLKYSALCLESSQRCLGQAPVCWLDELKNEIESCS